MSFNTGIRLISNEVLNARIIYDFISLLFNQRRCSKHRKYSFFLLSFKVDEIRDFQSQVFASIKSQTVVRLYDKQNVHGVGEVNGDLAQTCIDFIVDEEGVKLLKTIRWVV